VEETVISHYVRIALRNLIRHKGYSLINICGLAVGIACFLLILLYVKDELAYDSYNVDANRIFRVVKDFVNDDGSRLPDATTPAALAPALVRQVPGIESAVRIFPPWGFKSLLSYGEKTFYEESFLRVDSSFFSMFTFRLLRGEPASALARPHSIVITRSLASKYFGTENPLGKTMLFDGRFPLQVTAVIEDVPRQSHFRFNFLISIRTLGANFQNGYGIDSDWGQYNFYTYVKTKPGISISSLEPKIQAVFKSNQPRNDNIFYTQPLAGIDGIHLNSHLKWELEPNSDKLYIYVFLTIALFVLFIAGINYVNLTTAKSALRAREVGVRKVVGAFRSALVLQFLSESVLLSLFATLLATGITELALPFFNSLTQKELSLFSPANVPVWPLIALVGVLVGLAAGLYPSVALSSWSATSILRKIHSPRRSPFDLRKVLVVFQFTLSVILIVGVIVVQQQMNFIQTAKLGFNKDQVVVIRNVAALLHYGDEVRASLAKVPGVLKIAPCDGMIGGQNWTNTLRAKGSQNGQLVNFLSVGYDFLDALGLELKEGRNFSPLFPSDSLDGIILNETAVKQLGIPQPVIGQQIVWAQRPDTTIYVKVVGVVRNFHFTSFRQEIKPFAFVFTPRRTWFFAARLSAGNIRQTLGAMEKTWNALVPGRPFDYYFLDESINKLYRSEHNFQTVFSSMTMLSIVIASLGLLGLAAFTAERRTKEIGIRKVLGSSVTGIVALLSKDFLKLVGVAVLIAWPVAWFVMRMWLQDFAYRVELGWWAFILAGLFAVVIALLTVSTQAVRAAAANPVEALRYE
jgi:putative ABC transport system permease protein